VTLVGFRADRMRRGANTFSTYSWSMRLPRQKRPAGTTRALRCKGGTWGLEAGGDGASGGRAFKKRRARRGSGRI